MNADGSAGDESQDAVELDVMLTGTVPTPATYVYRGGGPSALGVARVLRDALLPGGDLLDSPCLAYVIRHPSAGVLLIDTGFHSDATTDRRKDFGPAMSLLFRSLKAAEIPYEAQLRSLGVEPDRVERVVMTHLHVDHTSGMRLLPNASFAITRREWEAANEKGAPGKGFVRHHFPPSSRLELLDIDVSGEPYGPFDRTIDLLGDGTVRLISTPGHTEGHMSVLLQLEAGRQVLVVGDASYTLRAIREQSLPLFTVSDKRYRRTLEQLKAFMDQEPDAIVVPSHDPTAWHQLRQVTPSAENALAGASG